MGWFLLLAINIGLSLISRLLRPKPKRPKAQDLEGWFADEGRPIPIVYGVQALSPNVVWWGDVFRHTGDEQTTFYHASMLGTLCLGPVVELVDLQFGGKSLALEPTFGRQSSSRTDPVLNLTLPLEVSGDGPTTLDVHARYLFGGPTQEGGVEGEIRFYRGTPGQPVDELTTRSMRQDNALGQVALGGTARPGVVYLAIGGGDGADSGGASASQGRFYWGQNPHPPSLVVLVRTEPRALLDLNLASPLNAAYTEARIGFDANAAEVIYDLVTHPQHGQGVSPILLDLQRFVDFAAVCQAEGRGISLTVSGQDEVHDLIDEVKKHAECELFEDPVTGLLSLSWARPGYALEDLRVISPTNARNLRIETPHWGELANEVRLTYRKWAGGTFGPVVSEPASRALTFEQVALTNPPYPQTAPYFIYSTKGRNITNVSVFVGTTELTPLTDYDFDAASGAFRIFNNPTTLALVGQQVTTSYSSAPTAMGLKEAVVAAFDLADQQVTGEVRSVTVDFPYFTQELIAQAMVQRQLRAMGLPLARATWDMDRSGFDLLPLEPVRLQWPAFDLADAPLDLVLRVGEVGYGRLESGWIKVEAIVDVWGEDVLPALPSSAGEPTQAPPTCPAMSMACGLGGAAVRLAFFPSDQTFTIQLWGADDETGLNAIVVGEYAGTTPYVDDPAGTSHQGRLVRDGWDAGPFTPWITCEPADETEDPVCVLPTYVWTADQALGTATLTVTDPQVRIRGVLFRHRSGGGAWSAWAAATATGDTYTDSVTLDPAVTSRIEWEITYQTCAGPDDIFAGAVDFVFQGPPDDVPPGNDALLAVPIDIALLTAPMGFTAVAAARTPLSAERQTTRKFPLANFVSGRVEAAVWQTSLPVGAKIGVEFYNPITEAWEPLDGDAGPVLAVDPASIGADDLQITAGEPVALVDAARDDVRLRAVLFGGDEGAGTLILAQLAFQPLAQAAELPPPEIPDPPIEIPEVPPACEGGDGTDYFTGYVDQADLEAFWSLNQGSDPSATMTLEPTGGRAGGAAARLDNGGFFESHNGPTIERIFADIPVGAEVDLKGWYKISASLANSAGCGLFVQQGPLIAGVNALPSGDSLTVNLLSADDDTDWKFFDLPTTATAGTGGAMVRLGWGDIAFFQACPGSIWFTELEVWVDGVKQDICAGSDAGSPGSGTGGGSEGTDPVPDPAPATTVRPFGAFSIPTKGAGNWNCTVKSIRPAYIANGLLSQATANGLTLFGQMAGSKSGWTNPDGTFSLTRWKQRLDELAGDAEVDAAIADGTLVGHYLIDQPYAASTYGGQVVGPATLNAMAAYSKTLWPTLPTYIRAAPSRYASASMPDLDGYWAQYSTRFGDCATWRDQQIAIATTQGKLLVVGLNVIDGGEEGAGYGSGDPADPSTGRWMSAGEVVRYGSIMAGHVYPSAFVIWQYQADWYAQSGMPAGLATVAAVLADFDP